MRRLVVFLAVALVVVPGCSLTGLDRFDWPSCDQCDVLNERDGIDTAGACELWRCDAQSQECVFTFRDEDGDSHAPLRCGGDDCDDTVASAYAGATEICNAVDDDCNGWIDDAASDAAASDTVLSAAQPPRWLSAETVAGGGLVAAYQTAGGAGVEVVSDAEADITPGEPLVLATSSPPYAVTSSGVADGCASAVRTVIPERLMPCAAEAPECPAGQQCYDSAGGERLCGMPRSASPPAPPLCNSDAECDDGIFCNGSESCQPGATGADPTTGCRPNALAACTAGQRCIEEGRICESVSPSLAACAISEAAIASAGDGEWLAAAVTTNGCAPGALRLGYFVELPRAPDTRYPVRRIVQRGDSGGVRSTSWLGIDVDASERCPGPGTGRAEGAPRGVAGPVIAALPFSRDQGRLRPQGLVAYLAGPVCRSLGNCSSDASMRPEGADGSLDVELVGVWLEEGSASSAPVGWVNATGSGEPVRLGVSTSEGATRPALRSWTSGTRAGYLVAYPVAGGGIAVHVVAAMDDPSPQCPSPETMCETSDQCAEGEVCRRASAGDPMGRCQLRPCISEFDARVTQVDDEPRVTPELVVPAAMTRFASADVAGDVALALGRTHEDGVIDVAFAWEEADAIAVGLATFDPANGTFTEGRVERFDATAPDDLAITHVSEGMIREGAELDGAPVEDGLRGGFVATWRDDPDPEAAGAETRAVRIADYDGSLVAPGAVVIGPSSVQPRAWVDATDRLRVLAHQGDAFQVIPAVCGQRAR